jgi:hypothetical protein
MKHWTVKMLHKGTVSREWHVWAEALTIGSHGAAKVRLPLPVEAWALRLTELTETQTFQIGEFSLQIADTTSERTRLWERAQIRIETQQKVATRSVEIATVTPSTLRTAITALCLAGITQWVADTFADRTAPESHPSLPEISWTAPASAPVAPYATVSAPAAAESGALIAVASAKAPTSVRLAVVSSPAPQQVSHLTSSQGSGLYALDPASGLPPTAVALASWPSSGAVSWDSRDQPPPAPPH